MERYWYVGIDDQGEIHLVNQNNKKYLNKKIEWLRYKTKAEALDSVKDYVLNYNYRPDSCDQDLRNLCSTPPSHRPRLR